MERVEQYAEFSADTRVLEIGPGYGRILATCLERHVPFAHYCGLDLSETNVTYLRERFPQANVEFVHGDVELASFDQKFDVVLSSLTLKHLFPSCEQALKNIARSVTPGGVFCLDFLEANEPWSTWHKNVSIRAYSRSELLDILDRSGLEHVAFDEVRHLPDPERWRLLVVAKRG
jgi:ubiquinone/menaquinone biosynthesis C-methylase UbiE